VSKDPDCPRGRQIVEVQFEDGSTIKTSVDTARGVEPPLSNNEVVDKWRLLTKDVIGPERANKIESIVLNLEECDDLSALLELMEGLTRNPIE
jgi:aconitate decarboxylase